MNATATGRPPDVDTYVEELRRALSDLAPDERDDLLAEVEASLLEGAEEGEEPIAARLGPPAAFAADLRASAGLPPAPDVAAARTDLRARIARLTDSTHARSVLALGRELAPIWWAARALIAVTALALLTGQASDVIAWSSSYVGLPGRGSEQLSVLELVVAVAASIAIGLAGRRRRLPYRGAVIALDLVLLACLVPIWGDLNDARERGPAQFIESLATEAPAGLALDGTAVDNVYPYDRRGRLLHDVRLYDAAGRPLDIGRDVPDPDRRPVLAATGGPQFNTFPIRYFEPGTRRVADSEAAPVLTPPALVTPPLKPPPRP